MTEKKYTERLGVRVKPETAIRIREDAAREELDSSDIIRRAINKYYQDKDGIQA